MVEKGNRGGICHSIYQYAGANNNKYMKDYGKNKKWSNIQYWDAYMGNFAKAFSK